jgi:hypothetical protein
VVVTRYIPIFVDFLSTSKWPDDAVTSLLQGGPCLKKIEKLFFQGYLQCQPYQKSYGNPDFYQKLNVWIGVLQGLDQLNI